MLALVGRRARWLGCKGEAAAAQLLGDVLQATQASDPAHGSPTTCTWLPPAAAAEPASSGAAWAAQQLRARRFNGSASSWLVAPPPSSSSSSRSEEQQQPGGSGGSSAGGAQTAAATAGSSTSSSSSSSSSSGGRPRIVTGTWLDRLPQSWIPYAQLARIEKPIGTWLLAWPCFWSIALAAPAGALPDPRLLAMFGAGAVLLRGAGCTINDLWDRELDKQVERTRGRPLAAGTVTPKQAVGAPAEGAAGHACC